ncbi:hypothetical protein, partial [Brochothrix thermosphacta]|uniref:hypothetical protein n=1 Tax=Brochothrix thermosphacta TaxID=2756 RepID=UPI001C403A98
ISNIVNVNFSNISIQSSAQNFIEMILGYKKIPYPLIQLKNAKKLIIIMINLLQLLLLVN